MVQLIVAPSQEQAKYNNKLFLAGGITNCPDWQSEVIQRLGDTPITVYNPRRANWDMNDPTCSAELQIKWEYERLHSATELLFWFPEETICPIVLFELGAHLKDPKFLIIGIHPNYIRKLDVELQSKLARPPIEIFYSLDGLISRFIYRYHLTCG